MDRTKLVSRVEDTGDSDSVVLKRPALRAGRFIHSFLISFVKYNWLLKKIHSPGSMPLRLRFPAGLWDR